MNRFRDENSIFELIKAIANKNNDILALFMNGSRTNKNIEKDILQDFDIVFVVKDVKKLVDDQSWLLEFGNILLMQMPDKIDVKLYNVELKKDSFTWLIIFDDGNRIDLTIMTLDCAKKRILEDKLCKIILDKNNILPKIPESTDEDYWVKPLSKNQFEGYCNEFWWLLNNVIKGIKREELLFANDMINLARHILIYFLEIKVGIAHDFKISVGKSGKYLKNLLSKEMYLKLLMTYQTSSTEDMWKALDILCQYFSQIAQEIAVSFDFEYLKSEEEGLLKYLSFVKNLKSIK